MLVKNKKPAGKKIYMRGWDAGKKIYMGQGLC